MHRSGATLGTGCALLVLLAALSLAPRVHAADTLRVGIQFASPEQRTILTSLKLKFEKAHPGVRVFYVFLPEQEYMENARTWLDSGEGPEVLYWHAGERLHGPARRGKLAPLGDVWRANQWDMVFTPGMRDALSQAGEVFALPLTHNHWGFYYRKSLFARLGIDPPRNWADLLSACSTLRDAGVTPIALGTKDSRTAAAWFDYLNLRMHGYPYHREVLEGRIPYTAGRLRAVFQAWSHLVLSGFFNADHRSLRRHGVIPRLHDEQAGMLLLDNFASMQSDPEMANDIGFFPFPSIRPGVRPAENALTDLLVVPHYAAANPHARAFLAWFGRADSQAVLNDAMGTVPPHASAPISDKRLVREGAHLLRQSAGLVQNYDREVPRAMVEPALAAFVDFLDQPDAAKLADRMETLRRKYYPDAGND